MVEGKGDNISSGKKERRKGMKSVLSIQKQRRTVPRSLCDEDNDTQWPKRTVDMQCPGQSLPRSINAEHISVFINNKKRVTLTNCVKSNIQFLNYLKTFPYGLGTLCHRT